MRYRKSVKITKGIRANFSKSGVSFTFGKPGASVNVGKKGTYVNYGIPGTGLYDRKRITGRKKTKPAQKRQRVVASEQPEKYKLSYGDDGKVTLFDSCGNIVTDNGILRSIRQRPEYMAAVEQLSEERLKKFHKIDNAYLELYKQSTPVLPVSFYELYLKKIQPKRYQVIEFSELEPTIQSVEEMLRKQAVSQIKTIKFWEKKQQIEKFVSENFSNTYEKMINDWKKRKQSFDDQEMLTADDKNREYLDIYQRKVNYLQNQLDGDKKTIDHAIEDCVDNLKLPFDIELHYSIKGQSATVDITLPSIETLPKHLAQKMANGTVKVKDKPKKMLKENYYSCVIGLAIYLSSELFHYAMGIDQIVLSAYIKNDNAEYNIKKGCVYSIIFTREAMTQIHLNQSVSEIFSTFENRCDLKADMTFKIVEPLNADF